MKRAENTSFRMPLVPKIIAISGAMLFICPGVVMMLLHPLWKRVPDGGTASDRLLASALGFAIAVIGGVIPATVLHYMKSNRESSEG